MTRKELKLQAKESLKGNWLQIILILLFVSIITNPGTGPTFYYTIIGYETPGLITNFDLGINLILSGFITTGLCRYLLNFIDVTKDSEFSDLFSYAKYFFKLLGLYILIILLIVLGMFLLIIPGVILGYCYSQAFYIMAEDPELSITECMKKSRQLMDGHKGELFILHLSFIGWVILAILTAGIGLLWLNPYMKVTETYYYLSLKEENSIY